MANSASDARQSELEIRKKLIEDQRAHLNENLRFRVDSEGDNRQLERWNNFKNAQNPKFLG